MRRHNNPEDLNLDSDSTKLATNITTVSAVEQRYVKWGGRTALGQALSLLSLRLWHRGDHTLTVRRESASQELTGRRLYIHTSATSDTVLYVWQTKLCVYWIGWSDTRTCNLISRQLKFRLWSPFFVNLVQSHNYFEVSKLYNMLRHFLSPCCAHRLCSVYLLHAVSNSYPARLNLQAVLTFFSFLKKRNAYEITMCVFACVRACVHVHSFLWSELPE